MDRSRVSDFSIERILSKPQVGFSPDRYIPEIRGGFVEPGNPAPVPVPLPVPVPVLGCLQYRGVGFGDSFYAYGTAFHHFSGPHPNCGVCGSFRPEAADVRVFAGQHAAGEPLQTRQKPRMRTVFTDSQNKHLEALFQLTDYPAVDARAELARHTGLSEETVRVWFKNRRARRKRQRSSSRRKTPRPSSPSAPAGEAALHLLPLSRTGSLPPGRPLPHQAASTGLR